MNPRSPISQRNAMGGGDREDFQIAPGALVVSSLTTKLGPHHRDAK